MSIKPYLNSSGKIKSSLIEGGGGGSQNLAQVLAVGDDANNEDIININSLKCNTIDGKAGALLIGLNTPSTTLQSTTNTEISGIEVRLFTTDLKFPEAGIFSNSVGASAGKYLIIKDNLNNQYKIELFAMA